MVYNGVTNEIICMYMKKISFGLLALLAFMLSGCAPIGDGPVFYEDATKPKAAEEAMNAQGDQVQNNQAANKQEQNNQQNAARQDNTMKQANIDTSLAEKYSGAVIHTSMGDITVAFYGEDAPLAVSNFLGLAKDGFYDGTKFHRVIPQFMIQGGDPNSKDDDWSNDGQGGPGYTFQDEINDHKLVRGSLAMANAGPNTNGSQFFIVTAKETPWLDGGYTDFGEVTDGMDTVDKIEAVPTNENDHPTEDVTIESVDLVEK